MTAALSQDLPRLCAEIEGLLAVHAIVVEGALDHLSSSADTSEFDNKFDDLEGARCYQKAIKCALAALSLLGRPTLAKFQESSVDVALAFDVRFAVAGAHQDNAHLKLELLDRQVKAWPLVDAISSSAEKDLQFNARSAFAAESLRFGLMGRILSPTTLDLESDKRARAWTAFSRTSIRGSKKRFRATLASIFRKVCALAEASTLENGFRDSRAAFAEKRTYNFAHKR